MLARKNVLRRACQTFASSTRPYVLYNIAVYCT